MCYTSSPSSYQLSIATQLGVGILDCPSFHAHNLSGSILYRSCTNCHNHCEFTCANLFLFPGNTILMTLFLQSWLLQSFFSLMMTSEPWKHSVCDMDVSFRAESFTGFYPLHTTDNGFCVNCHQLHKKKLL